ncbi:hydroxyectoine utilization dehydratase EutB [Microvirga makkahensis]|uniref:Hydroxyectoine utilization dehydratase EutB n=1 Tax=Microvirga makkahensis TaxID=1128670 RepID=A0A7X3MU22_9HYPH|nr:hydroxyectoine utilization dehydratase EutB [Microvirga makkahensis]MXQ13156.1 hydroxyectoine utilization dehydratase EutB [Microvirga makkahensis]
MIAVGPDRIAEAQARIAGRVRRTPLAPSPSLSARAGAPVLLKLESHQATGSFKLRGATNAVLSLSQEARQRGLVTASTGNHGRALAHAAKAEGVRAVICMSALVPANKVEAVRALGAEVRIVGRSQDDAQEEVERLVREAGLTAVPPFDHAEVIAGQGTIGLEIAEARPDAELVLVPLSGGGLAAGTAMAVKSRLPRARVIGVSMERGAAMHESLRAGRPVLVEEMETLADSLGGGIGLENRYTFAMCRDLLDEIVLLSEEEIAGGIRHAFTAEGEIVEGAGAVGIAALLAGKVEVKGPTVVVVSGRNIDEALHGSIVNAAAGEAVSPGGYTP